MVVMEMLTKATFAIMNYNQSVSRKVATNVPNLKLQ